MTTIPTPTPEELDEARAKVTAFVEKNEMAPALRHLGRRALADEYIFQRARSELEDWRTDPQTRITRTLALLEVREEFPR